MQIREAQWLGERLAEIPDADLFPILNLGSSTAHFRTIAQPQMEEFIFAPLRARAGTVLHADIKPDDGVDLVGDLLDPAYQQRLIDLRCRCVLVNNILHHLPNREPIMRLLPSLVLPGGYLVISGPHAYPRHLDPIDTMYRPTPEQIAAEFPGLDLIAGAIIDSGDWRTWRARERGQRSLPRTLLRLALPFYKHAEWRRLAVQAPYILRSISAFAVVLRTRTEESA